ncbi:hypothetical protein [Burkholderia vietnamiensis]|uniref:hypothetical protein n=1 Tax=Burkholderia vietnamiensis TaxID=60552 RepID=UPI001593875F|nr:hypothetical protein [Burkholderia vietnamiensis]
MDVLREKVKTNALSLNTAAQYQREVIAFFGGYLDCDDLASGLSLLKSDPAVRESTVPPSEDAQARVLSLCYSLFTGLATLVTDGLPYPHQIILPALLGWPDNAMWVFPTTSWCMPPHLEAERPSSRFPSWGYNFAEGRLATLAEVHAAQATYGFRAVPGAIIRQAGKQVEVANANSRHTHRLTMGVHALNAFMVLFCSLTGMNWAQVVELPWSKDFEVSTPRQAFRAIKWRGGNRVVHFELPVGFMPAFKLYLALRDYLLKAQSCDLLFFRLGPKNLGPATPIKTNLTDVYHNFRRIDPKLPSLGARHWRAAKSDWLIRKTDPATAALILQNGEQTVRRAYAAGSHQMHMEELSVYLEQVADVVIRPGSDGAATTSAVGACVSFGNPVPIAISVEAAVDCRTAEGCLFCNKHRVHVDAQDVRKLVSCRYCLRQSVAMFSNEEQMQEHLGPIFARIQAILDEVSRHDSALVARVTREVDEDGELDSYWESKLQMLMSLGAPV